MLLKQQLPLELLLQFEEISLRVIANRAFFRSFRALDTVSAVSAFPNNFGRTFKNLTFNQRVEQGIVSFFVAFFDFGNGLKQKSDFGNQSLADQRRGLYGGVEHFLRRLVDGGKSSIAFVIGGSLGLSDAVLKRADYKLSFSRMTYPHQLMQMILLEQIYRGYRIMNHEPYHK